MSTYRKQTTTHAITLFIHEAPHSVSFGILATWHHSHSTPFSIWHNLVPRDHAHSSSMQCHSYSAHVGLLAWYFTGIVLALFLFSYFIKYTHTHAHTHTHTHTPDFSLCYIVFDMILLGTIPYSLSDPVLHLSPCITLAASHVERHENVTNVKLFHLLLIDYL